MYLGLRTNWDLVEGLKAVKNGGGIGDAVRWDIFFCSNDSENKKNDMIVKIKLYIFGLEQFLTQIVLFLFHALR